MPVKAINNYTFYKIVCLDNSCDLCYVGSTANFNKRRNRHKSDCYNQNSRSYNIKIYKIIRENGGWDNFKMIEIGRAEQLTKRQAEQIEDEYRIELKANVNMRRCYLTKEQKQEYKQEYQQKYREENRDKILEHQHKYSQKYRQDNRDKINDKQKEKIVCECGCEIIRCYLSRHKQSNKHINLLNNKS